MKTSIILQREYLTRVKKRSFIIMTLLAPLLMAGVMIGYMYMIFADDTEEKKIGIVDETMLVYESISNSDYLKFELLPEVNMEQAKELYNQGDFYAILFIPGNIMSSNKVQVYSKKQPSQSVTMYISNSIKTYLEDKKIIDEGITRETLKGLKVNLNLDTIKWTEEGEEVKSSTGIAMAVGYLAGFLIYMFIFMYGVQVMRGVIEEKTNRIIEVVVSSVKPFQLMMGKIIGIALVGLTQFIAWIVLVALFTSVGFNLIAPEYQAEKITQQEEVKSILDESTNSGVPASTMDVSSVQNNNKYVQFIREATGTINIPTMVLSFLFYFLAGYLLYSSLFAAIGSAVDAETDTQQFMMPITIPLLLGLIVMMNAIQNPDGNMAFWFSMIPFTSPIVMIARIPFGVPYWEVGLSMGILVLTFLGTTWLAGKIYRTGILMYGKKVSYKEIWKWLKYNS